MNIKDNYTIVYNEIENKTNKYYQEITFILILRGCVQIEILDKFINLTEGEVILLNINDMVTIINNTKEASLFVELHIDTLYFATQFPNIFQTHFECTPKQRLQGKMDSIRNIRKKISEICLLEFNKESTNKLKANIALNQILYILVQQFIKDQDSCNYHFNNNDKLYEILKFIEENFKQSLSLNTVADYFFMSSSSLSKFFKKNTGVYFSEYIKKLAIKKSLKEIINTNQSIEIIALNYGFKNSKTYRESFKKILKTTPTNYRNDFLRKREYNKSPQKINNPNSKKELVLLLYRYCKFEDDEIDYTTSYIQKKEIKINLINSKQSKKDSSFIINIGSLDNLAIKNVEDEILYLKSIKMISHVQFQKLFSNLPLNFSTNDRIDLNYFPIFEKLDRIICFLYEQNIGVFLNIDISDFESNNYKLLYKNFFLHMHNQFNNEIFKSWNINIVFNKKIVEGNLYKFKEIKKYFKYISPQILIGIQIHLENFEDNNLIFLKEILIDCNFISYKEYSGILTKDQSNQTDINDKQDFLTKKINIISSLLRENSINLPLYLLEWNTITGKTNTTNGSFFRGAIIIQEYIHLNPFVAGFGFWLNIDLYENNACHLSDNNKYGLQLFHYNQKKRPVFFCLQLINRMEGNIIAKGSNYIFTKNKSNYQLLIWNCNYFDPYLSLEKSFISRYKIDINILISNLPPQTYLFKQINLDYKNGALFYTYDKFKNIRYLDNELEEYISRSTQPKINAFEIDITDIFSYCLTLESNAVSLIELTPYIS